MKSYEDWLLEQRGWKGIAARALREQRDGIDRNFLRNHEDQNDIDFFVQEDEKRTIIQMVNYDDAKPVVTIEAWIVRRTAEMLSAGTSTHAQDEFLVQIIDTCKDAPKDAFFGFSKKQYRWFSHLVKTSDQPCALIRKKMEKIGISYEL